VPAGGRGGPGPAGRPPAEGIRLTPTEWHLLEVLLRNPGKLLSRNQLLTEVWGPGYADATGNLRLYMAQLRRQARAGPGQAALADDRARDGLPLPAGPVPGTQLRFRYQG